MQDNLRQTLADRFGTGILSLPCGPQAAALDLGAIIWCLSVQLAFMLKHNSTFSSMSQQTWIHAHIDERSLQTQALPLCDITTTMSTASASPADFSDATRLGLAPAQHKLS
jgi:hypothetical protein